MGEQSDSFLFDDTSLNTITDFCKQLWPLALEETIEVEFLDQGTFNQVFAISCADIAGQLQDVVLRLPSNQSSIPCTVAILGWLNKHTDLNVPKVITWDASKDNPLGHGYIILSRIPGTSLQKVMGDLSQEQKLIVAKQLAQLYQQMESITSPIAGRIKVHGQFSPGDDTSDNVFIQPFGTGIGSSGIELHDDCKNPVDWNNTDNGLLPIERLRHDPPNLSVNEIMLPIYQRRIYTSLNRPVPEDHLLILFEPLQEMVQDMVDIELFEPVNDHICLQHPDFLPRNIMVDFTPDPVITGIIDWDDANFVPRFAARVPPGWLWQSGWWKEEDGDERDRGDMLDEDGDEGEDETCEECDEDYDWIEEPLDVEKNAPQTPEDAEIKRVFEEAVGERWVWESTKPWFPFARRLLRFSQQTLFFGQDFTLVSQWKDKWEALFPANSDGSENSENSDTGEPTDHQENDDNDEGGKDPLESKGLDWQHEDIESPLRG
ncbi:hypothetical protein PG993_007442 [Apiospora rasikravindrae]|uniref:Aminoglycoside phosphotransferase domain-containing protein n=1 Tax=Apiospora rasikravindrae TaxID=990691 RepID=A0ABR1SXH4_9PEZI